MSDYAEEGLKVETPEDEHRTVQDTQREQLVRTVAKNFYSELIRYGIAAKDIINVSTCLLDCVLKNRNNSNGKSAGSDRIFSVNDIKDEWGLHRRLSIEDVTITPLDAALSGQVASWLVNPAVRYSFVSPFPDTAEALNDYFGQPGRVYFAISFKGAFVGIIGAEGVDPVSGRLEMRKFIGDANFRGKGIGKRCVFLFLYYCFVILGMHKVYLYSTDSNIRNINLNTKMGFQFEGIFYEDIVLGHERHDVVRMGLLGSRWMEMFSQPVDG